MKAFYPLLKVLYWFCGFVILVGTIPFVIVSAIIGVNDICFYGILFFMSSGLAYTLVYQTLDFGDLHDKAKDASALALTISIFYKGHLFKDDYIDLLQQIVL